MAFGVKRILLRKRPPTPGPVPIPHPVPTPQPIQIRHPYVSPWNFLLVGDYITLVGQGEASPNGPALTGGWATLLRRDGVGNHRTITLAPGHAVFGAWKRSAAEVDLLAEDSTFTDPAKALSLHTLDVVGGNIVRSSHMPLWPYGTPYRARGGHSGLYVFNLSRAWRDGNRATLLWGEQNIALPPAFTPSYRLAGRYIRDVSDDGNLRFILCEADATSVHGMPPDRKTFGALIGRTAAGQNAWSSYTFGDPTEEQKASSMSVTSDGYIYIGSRAQIVSTGKYGHMYVHKVRASDGLGAPGWPKLFERPGVSFDPWVTAADTRNVYLAGLTNNRLPFVASLKHSGADNAILDNVYAGPKEEWWWISLIAADSVFYLAGYVVTDDGTAERQHELVFAAFDEYGLPA